MALLSLQNLSLSFGGPPLLDGLNLQVHQGEKIGLLGRNGEGKSCLMKLICRQMEADKGEIARQQGVKIGYLAQEVPQDMNGTVLQTLQNAAQSAVQNSNHNDMDDQDSWRTQKQVEIITVQMHLDPQAYVNTLSAGLRRRVLLARELVRDPDILLLDEPTNHLDIDSIIWLENFLLRYGRTLLFVTHDRMLLKKLATRIIELDRGKIYDWSCDYETFLKRKQTFLDSEVKQWAVFDQKLSQEEIWIRQGIKARRTRNEGRVRALEKMRSQRMERRERIGTVRMQLQEAERAGKLVIEAKHLEFNYSANPIVKDFSTIIMRGDKVGIIGPNGAGKTTLLKLLLTELTPQQGQVRLGTKLEVAYFDQLRAHLDNSKTVADNVGEGNDTITINGKQRHVISYLQDFLFSPQRARTPVEVLSGGERNRLLLAKLFAKPSNLLVLDEPTNDLDKETLELLEVLLINYRGTILLVSHDRAFINNVVTSTMVFEGYGLVNEYAGGYDDWQLQRKKQKNTVPNTENKKEKKGKKTSHRTRPRRLTFKEQRELEELPGKIEALEEEQSNIYKAMADPGFYQNQNSEISGSKLRLESIETELIESYQRWEHLEEISQN